MKRRIDKGVHWGQVRKFTRRIGQRVAIRINSESRDLHHPPWHSNDISSAEPIKPWNLIKVGNRNTSHCWSLLLQPSAKRHWFRKESIFGRIHYFKPTYLKISGNTTAMRVWESLNISHKKIETVVIALQYTFSTSQPHHTNRSNGRNSARDNAHSYGGKRRIGTCGGTKESISFEPQGRLSIFRESIFFEGGNGLWLRRFSFDGPGFSF